MNTTENKNRAPKKAKWDKPVTKAFYEKLRRKAAFVVREMHEVPGYIDIIMNHVDRYLLYHEPPYYYTDHMWICSFFAAVRDDIEDAIVRRKRAKERAAERKAARERAKAEAEAEAMKTPEPEATEAPATEAAPDSEQEPVKDEPKENKENSHADGWLGAVGRSIATNSRRMTERLTSACRELFKSGGPGEKADDGQADNRDICGCHRNYAADGSAPAM